MRRPLVLLGLALGLSGSSCGPVAGPTQVVLVVCDTLRADHLSTYGYGRPTSPVLTEFAEGATLYRRFQASAPWTLPSHASMFTGLEPTEHGARTLTAEELAALQAKGWQGQNNAAPLAASHVTLAEHLREKGCATAAIVANTAYLDPRFGVAQGFEHYDRRRGDVTDVTSRALAWVEAHREESFLLVLNFMDTHRPYNTRPRADLPDRSSEGNLLKRLVPVVMDPERQAEPALLEALVDQYDTAIGNLDEGLGVLLDGLRTQLDWDALTLAVTSDHGEFLGEHGLIEHSKDVYQGTLGIPLIVKARGQSQGAVEQAWASHVHLPGILLDAAGIARDTAPPTFVRHWPLGRARSENTDSRLHDLRQPWGSRLRRTRRVLAEGSTKTIVTSDGTSESYDLTADPEELQPLAAPEAGALADAAREAHAALEPAPPAEPFEPDAAMQGELDALGYGGGSGK